MVGIPRIARWRKRQGETRAADREFEGPDLAEQNAAARGKLLLHRAIGLWNVVAQQVRMARRANACCRVNVLERVRNALERTGVDAAGEAVVGALRFEDRALA